MWRWVGYGDCMMYDDPYCCEAHDAGESQVYRLECEECGEVWPCLVTYCGDEFLCCGRRLHKTAAVE